MGKLSLLAATAVCFALVAPCALAQGVLGPAKPAPAFSSLPDWSGAWFRDGGEFIESTPADLKKPPPPASSPRRHPPYTPKFEAIYQGVLKKIAIDRYPDPISTCGTPAGWPRMLGTPDAYEFVVRPEQTWLLSENGPNIVRVYTDGRDHPPADEMWNTYTGSNVGHWEGDTLVFHSKGMWGVGHAIFGRAGVVFSDKVQVTTRIHEDEGKHILVELLITDGEALTRPWPVTVRFTRLPKGSTVWDYACAENNRNPITEDGQTLTVSPQGKVIDLNAPKTAKKKAN